MFFKKIYKIVKSEKNTVNYLIEEGILSDDKKCWKCKIKFKLDLERLRYRCPKKRCKKEKLMLEGTFFETSKIRLNKLLFMCYEYLKKTPLI